MAFVRSFVHSLAHSRPMLNVKLRWRTFAVITFATAILCSTCKYLFIECSQTFMKCMLCFHIIRLLLEICSSFSIHWKYALRRLLWTKINNSRQKHFKKFRSLNVHCVFHCFVYVCVCLFFSIHFLLVLFHRTTLSAQSNQP